MSAQILYPKPTQKSLYEGLVTQCKSLSLPFPTWDDVQHGSLREKYDLIVDAMFGFSFKVGLYQTQCLQGIQRPQTCMAQLLTSAGRSTTALRQHLGGFETACQPATDHQRRHSVRCMVKSQWLREWCAGPVWTH